MADTSSYSIEELLVASLWVHERQHTGQPISQVVFRMADTSSLSRSSWWQVCECMRESTRGKPCPKWWLRSGNGLIRHHHEGRQCWIGKNERSLLEVLKTGRGVGENNALGSMCSGCRFHWTFPSEVDTETILRAWCATVNNARPHEEILECEAVMPNFREWAVGWRHGSALWIMPCSAGHILKCRIPLKGSFQWRMCHLSQCTRQKCGVLVKGESQFHAGVGT